jgi:hypothetical protein
MKPVNKDIKKTTDDDAKQKYYQVQDPYGKQQVSS